MNKIIFLFSLLICTTIHAQMKVCKSYKFTNAISPNSKIVPPEITPRAPWTCNPKAIAVNFIFVQDDNGGNNFTAMGNPYNQIHSGYDFAQKTIELLNERNKVNIKMSIPPNHTIPNLPRNYYYALNSVYFVKSTVYNIYERGVDGFINLVNNTSINVDSHFNVYIQYKEFDEGRGGEAWGLSKTSRAKHTHVAGYGAYKKFLITDGKSSSEAFNIATENVANTLDHEIGHLLTLDHTVKYGDGCNCPCKKMPILYPPKFDTNHITGQITTILHDCDYINTRVVDTTCGDDVYDTPSAWYMVDTLNAPIHPGQSTSTHPDFFKWFSNNRMDYTGYMAFSPGQLERIHKALEKEMRSYLICNKLGVNKNLCNFDDNITSYYGKTLNLNKNCSINNKAIVNNKKYVNIYMSESTDFYDGFEVNAGGNFEVFYNCDCSTF